MEKVKRHTYRGSFALNQVECWHEDLLERHGKVIAACLSQEDPTKALVFTESGKKLICIAEKYKSYPFEGE